MKSNIIQSVKIIILGLIVSLGVGYVSAVGTWTNPNCAPPQCNTDTPLNVGFNTQSKLGALFLNTNSSPFPTGLQVAGQSIFDTIKVTGKVPNVPLVPVAVGSVLTAIDTAGTVGWAGGGSVNTGGVVTTGICVNVSTGVSGISTLTNKEINLSAGGKPNICADEGGCAVRLLARGVGASQYNGANYQPMLQESNGWWASGVGLTGTNGNTTENVVLSVSNVNGGLYDDKTGTETSIDKFTIVDNDANYYYTVSVCD